jgi:aryl-alcohol dehydrogenase-like predicted oxidoreductase
MLGHHDFGQQNTEAEGHEQMDYALEKGVNFGIQPRCILFLHVRKPTGILKELLEPGSKKTGRREEVVLASKIWT